MHSYGSQYSQVVHYLWSLVNYLLQFNFMISSSTRTSIRPFIRPFSILPSQRRSLVRDTPATRYPCDTMINTLAYHHSVTLIQMSIKFHGPIRQRRPLTWGRDRAAILGLSRTPRITRSSITSLLWKFTVTVKSLRESPYQACLCTLQITGSRAYSRV